jgi:single-stranded-DNA-specific exonuclease
MRWNILDDPPASFFDMYPEIPSPIASILYHRNVRTKEEIDEYLNPDYVHHVHDPFLFRDMEKTVTRIFVAIEQGERITIHGDYDADGVSASVILKETLEAVGAKDIDVFLPHRETDGYGVNLRTVDHLHKQGTTLIITCDCGISNVSEVAKAQELGMDVVITDHHSIPEVLPNAYAIVHPKVAGETYPYKDLAGGGVAFKLAQAILHTHKKTHDALDNGQAHDGFEKWLLEMVAIASVADMVPLIGESRTLTKYGLIVLNKTRRIGMQKLLLEARLMNEEGHLKTDIDATIIGFRIAPRINAAGRLGHANTAYQLLVTEDPTEAIDLAWQLDQSNTERRRLTDECVVQAKRQVADSQMDAPVLFVYDPSWSTGLVGLVASRIKSEFAKPAIAMGMNDGNITGSGRSIEGFNMIAALNDMPHCFAKFGGHPMACGFTLENPDMLDQCKKEMTTLFLEKTRGVDLQPMLAVDAQITLEEVTWELFDYIVRCQPFGQANVTPRYMARGCTVVSLQPVGKEGKHLRIMLRHKSNVVRKTIGWNLCNGEINWATALSQDDQIDIVFEVDKNEWNGKRELQLTIIDLQKTDA